MDVLGNSLSNMLFKFKDFFFFCQTVLVHELQDASGKFCSLQNFEWMGSEMCVGK